MVHRRVTALTVGALFAALLLAVAMIFSGAAGATRIAEASRSLNWANSTAAAAGTTRAAAAQAVVFAVDRDLGVAGDEAVESALLEAEENLAALLTWSAAPPPEAPDALLDDLAVYEAAVSEVLALAAAARPVAADRAQTELLTPRFERVMESLGVVQQGLADEIASAESTAGRIALTTRTLVMFLIPVAAILIYRRLARAELTRRRDAMNARLDAAEHLSRAKDEFIAGISHELRTPLTGICGFSQHLLDDDLADPAEARELLGLISSESAELSRMVEDLLTAGRLDADTFEIARESVVIGSAIQAVVAAMQRAGHAIELRGPNAVVTADNARVRQILRNLLSNAVKHGGDEIEVSTMVAGNELHCTVADSGAGVDPELVPRIFDRFVHDGTTPLLTGSVGLGLAISRSLAAHMGGDLTYERFSGWTAFTLSLPLADDQSMDIEPVVVAPALATKPPVADAWSRSEPAEPAVAADAGAEVELTLSRPSRFEPDFKIRFE
jgi:signal transduction histidine kinase